MKAITLWQPWATLVIIGAKTLETRSWPIAYRGPLAIHAAASTNTKLVRHLLSGEPFRSVLAEAGYDEVSDLPSGCVLGTVTVTDCESTNKAFYVTQQERAFGDFSPHRFAWTLEDPIRFPEPIPARGKQGLWDWEEPSL